GGEIARAMLGERAIFLFAQIAIESVREARRRDLLVKQLGLLEEYAGRCRRGCGRNKSPRGILEAGLDERAGPVGALEPFAVAGRGVKVEGRLPHGERV